MADEAASTETMLRRKGLRPPPRLEEFCGRLVAPAPAAAATTVSTPVAPTISATPAAVPATAARVLGLGTRFVHVEGASANLRTVQGRDGFFAILVAGHFHEAEAARSARVTVGHNADPIHLPEGLEHLPQFVFGSVKA